jgi:hypothetical protein
METIVVMLATVAGGILRSLLGYLRQLRIEGKGGKDLDVGQLLRAIVLAVVTGASVGVLVHFDPTTGLLIGYAGGSAADKAWQIIVGKGA